MDIFMTIITAILSLDTIRAVIAMLGWVKPDAKFAWIIYGRYERNLIERGLKDIGFSPAKSHHIAQKLKDVSNEVSRSTGITAENAPHQLIVLLAKYIVKFNQPIQYGGTRTTKSCYYIDTMGLSHCDEDRNKLCAIMIHLLNKNTTNSTKPNIVITPKGGNPLLAMEISEIYNAIFLLAKSSTDKSRISSVGTDKRLDFMVNYEGASAYEDQQLKGKCVVLDCNTSGGSQLLEIVKYMQSVAPHINDELCPPTEVYVLFCADENGANIDQKFLDHNCSIYRFFDLDEEIKQEIYALTEKHCKQDGAELDFYREEVATDVESIISIIKEKNKYFYQ